ncbi:MAG TPA: hypothetical protein VFL70_04375 [Bacteroidia bacterium]|nr:hypothetical protein [Bacteroidia bacterium]
MKKLLRLSIVGFLLFSHAFKTRGQSPVLEKTNDVSGKSKRGFLGGVEVNKEKGTFDLVYLTSSFFTGAGNTKFSFDSDVPVEIYTYDKELNLLNTEKTKVSPKNTAGSITEDFTLLKW